MDDYLSKPLSANALAEKLETVTRKSLKELVSGER
jgi:YesN/AraC family two-component response regulator